MVQEGIVIDQLVRSIDIFPTIMAMAGIPVRHDIQGVSLLPAIKGKELHLEAFSELLSGPKRMAQSRGWKYIQRLSNPEIRELYNLKVDPEEKHNVYETEEEQRERMQKVYRRWFSENRKMARKFEPKKDRKMDEKVIEQLKALGYI